MENFKPLAPGTPVTAQVRPNVRHGSSWINTWPDAIGRVIDFDAATDHYRVRLLDGTERCFGRAWVTSLKNLHQPPHEPWTGDTPKDRILYRGACGPAASDLVFPNLNAQSLSVYLPPFDLVGGLYGEPPAVHNTETGNTSLDLAAFLREAVDADPWALECLFAESHSALTPDGENLRALGPLLISTRIYHTYTRRVLEAFDETAPARAALSQYQRNTIANALRQLVTGIATLREGRFILSVFPHRDRLLAIAEGTMSWDEAEAWRVELHREFEAAVADTALEREPDEWTANRLLQDIRRQQAATEPLGW